MRIAIDAKWYFTGPVSGRTVLHNLLPQLFKLYPEHHWIIFLDKKDKGKGFPFSGENITLEYVWAKNNMISNIFILPYFQRKLKPDIIVFQTFPSFRKNIPSIAIIYDVLFHDFSHFFSWKEKLYFFPLSWLTKKADRIIVTAKSVANDLAKHRYVHNMEHIDIIPLGVNEEFKPSDKLNSNLLKMVKVKFKLPDQFLLYVGRLNERKNIETLLKTIPLLNDQNIRLVIVGEPDWKTPDLKKLLLNKKIKERIIFTGSITNSELVAIYALSYIFCFPSFAEGFGLPPLEAMASGVPVIVSNTTSLPEVCGDAAVYIDPTNPKSVANAINDLIENEALYVEKKKAGLARASQFTWHKTAQEFMQSIIKTRQKKYL